jgi:hypothetical protein
VNYEKDVLFENTNTEDEALDSICTFLPPIAGEKYKDGEPVLPRCRATACMAWRWTFIAGEKPPWRGYCGRVGKP